MKKRKKHENFIPPEFSGLHAEKIADSLNRDTRARKLESAENWRPKNSRGRSRRGKIPKKSRQHGFDGFYRPYSGYLDCGEKIVYHDSAMLKPGGYTKKVISENIEEI